MRADRTPKPPSDKQLEANRLNAKKSTGPRTAAGRARSRMNALRHGVCARVVLLPGEDRGEYDVFAKEIVDELRPKGFVQQMLAGRVAALFWQLSRLPRAVKHLVKRGEEQRWHSWFVHRGLADEAWIRAHYKTSTKEPSPELAKAYERAGFNENDEDYAERQILRAYAEGDPPPDPHKPPGMIADAIAGQHGFEAVLKLDDYERRLWSALQSALRSLERRQKIDGGAEDGEATDDSGAPGEDPTSAPEVDDVTSTHDASAPCHCEPTMQDSDAADPPLAVSQTEARSPDCETATGEPAGSRTDARDRSAHRSAKPPSGDPAGVDVSPSPGIAETATAPARNEANSSGDAQTSGEAGSPARIPNSAGMQVGDGPSDVRTAGAERTHLAGDAPAQSPNEMGADPAQPPPN